MNITSISNVGEVMHSQSQGFELIGEGGGIIFSSTMPEEAFGVRDRGFRGPELVFKPEALDWLTAGEHAIELTGIGMLGEETIGTQVVKILDLARPNSYQDMISRHSERTGTLAAIFDTNDAVVAGEGLQDTTITATGILRPFDMQSFGRYGNVPYIFTNADGFDGTLPSPDAFIAHLKAAGFDGVEMVKLTADRILSHGVIDKPTEVELALRRQAGIPVDAGVDVYLRYAKPDLIESHEVLAKSGVVDDLIKALYPDQIALQILAASQLPDLPLGAIQDLITFDNGKTAIATALALESFRISHPTEFGITRDPDQAEYLKNQYFLPLGIPLESANEAARLVLG